MWRIRCRAHNSSQVLSFHEREFTLTIQRNPKPRDQATSDRMRRQRTSRTSPEDVFAECLTRHRYRVERNVSDLPGRPDLVLPRPRIAIFVHGCFWHGCPRHGTTPKNNQAWWVEKIRANQERDKRKARQLRKLGWHVMTVWEHTSCEACLRRVRRLSQGSAP